MSNDMSTSGLKVSERLYRVALPIWESYYDHPFVKGIADGTLPVSKFQLYMIQYLKLLFKQVLSCSGVSLCSLIKSF